MRSVHLESPLAFLAEPFHRSPSRPLNLVPVSLGALGKILAGTHVCSSWSSLLLKELCSMSCGGKKSGGYKWGFAENWCCAIARTASNNSRSLFHTVHSLSCCVAAWAVLHHGSCFLDVDITECTDIFFPIHRIEERRNKRL